MWFKDIPTGSRWFPWNTHIRGSRPFPASVALVLMLRCVCYRTLEGWFLNACTHFCKTPWSSRVSTNKHDTAGSYPHTGGCTLSTSPHWRWGWSFRRSPWSSPSSSRSESWPGMGKRCHLWRCYSAGGGDENTHEVCLSSRHSGVVFNW